ncbi:unnamed protein product [Lota lota]
MALARRGSSVFQKPPSASRRLAGATRLFGDLIRMGVVGQGKWKRSHSGTVRNNLRCSRPYSCHINRQQQKPSY